MRILAVDFGDARTGIAVSDPAEMLASPVCVLHETHFDRVAEQVAHLAQEHGAGEIVVGYPKNMNGTVGPRAEKSALFADTLRSQTGLPVQLWDERCTTVSAHVYMNATDTRGKKRKATVDAAAACIILQGYLDFKKSRTNTEN